MHDKYYILGQQHEYMGWHKNMDLSSEIFPSYFKTTDGFWYFIDESKIDTEDKMWSFLKGAYSTEGTSEGFQFANSITKIKFIRKILDKFNIEHVYHQDILPDCIPSVNTIALKDAENVIKRLTDKD